MRPRMKRYLSNTLAAVALVVGLVIGASGIGILAFLVGVVLAYTGLLSLISTNTDWPDNF